MRCYLAMFSLQLAPPRQRADSAGLEGCRDPSPGSGWFLSSADHPLIDTWWCLQGTELHCDLPCTCLETLWVL